MDAENDQSQRKSLEKAISAQENLRGILEDEAIDASIAALKEKIASLDSVGSQQRKLATILFMDIANHTALTIGLDPEEQMAIIDPVLARLAAVVDDHGGHITRYQGDGFKAVFGLPVALENDPQQAVRAGLQIQQESQEIAKELELRFGLSGFRVRVGISTGNIFSGGETEGEDTLKGHPVNLAARLEHSAAPGTVLISQFTYPHVRGNFVLQAMEPILVKGFSEPIKIYQVLKMIVSPIFHKTRGVEGVNTTMVGRNWELDRLQEYYYDVLEERERVMVTIVGDAGIGKSRLMYEFEEWLNLHSETFSLFKGQARLESRNMPYSLLRNMFVAHFKIQDDDPLHQVRSKLVTGIKDVFGLGDESEMKAHFISQLLGFNFRESPHLVGALDDPQQFRDRAWYYLENFFRIICEGNPVLIFLDNLHWADNSSLDVLNQLGLAFSGLPILIISETRPTLFEQRPNWGEGHNFHKHIQLEPLSRRYSRQLVMDLLKKIKNIPQNLQELVINQAEGNPFYLEELVRMLVDQGVIVKQEPFWHVEEERLRGVQVPATLTGVLQARVESLPESERVLLQKAAIVGRVFWDQVLNELQEDRKAVPVAPDISGLLEQLRDRGLVYRREKSTISHAAEYIFKHALLRDVAYESVLIKDRQAYHAQVADWLVMHSGERAWEINGLIADHLDHAGRQDDARAYLSEAGKIAAAHYAAREALQYFQRALDLTPDDRIKERYQLLLNRVRLYDLIGERKAQAADLHELSFLASELQDPEKQIEAELLMSDYFRVVSRVTDAIEAAGRALSRAEAASNQAWLAKSHLALGLAHRQHGEFENAWDHYRQALNLSESADIANVKATSLGGLGYLAVLYGDYSMGKTYFERALPIYRQLNDRRGEGWMLVNLGEVDRNLGDFSGAQTYYETALAIYRHTDRWGEIMAGNNLGLVCCNLGDFKKAREYLARTLELADQTANNWGKAIALNTLGLSLLGLGKLAQAVEILEQAIDIFKALELLPNVMEGYSGLARIALARNDQEEALRHVESILTFVAEGNSLNGVEEPLRIYLTCISVLDTFNDPRSDQVLEQANTLLQERAAKIPDDKNRQSFLQKVPWHREILNRWEALQARS